MLSPLFLPYLCSAQPRRLRRHQEAAIREELRVARDKEIETAIARLEEASAQETAAAEEQVRSVANAGFVHTQT